ncbi:MAG: hypothetical protein ABIH71_04245, partial [Candidatus Omnitrophota bacterium]
AQSRGAIEKKDLCGLIWARDMAQGMMAIEQQLKEKRQLVEVVSEVNAKINDLRRQIEDQQKLDSLKEKQANACLKKSLKEKVDAILAEVKGNVENDFYGIALEILDDALSLGKFEGSDMRRLQKEKRRVELLKDRYEKRAAIFKNGVIAYPGVGDGGIIIEDPALTELCLIHEDDTVSVIDDTSEVDEEELFRRRESVLRFRKKDSMLIVGPVETKSKLNVLALLKCLDVVILVRSSAELSVLSKCTKLAFNHWRRDGVSFGKLTILRGDMYSDRILDKLSRFTEERGLFTHIILHGIFDLRFRHEDSLGGFYDYDSLVKRFTTLENIWISLTCADRNDLSLGDIIGIREEFPRVPSKMYHQLLFNPSIVADDVFYRQLDGIRECRRSKFSIKINNQKVFSSPLVNIGTMLSRMGYFYDRDLSIIFLECLDRIDFSGLKKYFLKQETSERRGGAIMKVVENLAKDVQENNDLVWRFSYRDSNLSVAADLRQIAVCQLFYVVLSLFLDDVNGYWARAYCSFDNPLILVSLGHGEDSESMLIGFDLGCEMRVRFESFKLEDFYSKLDYSYYTFFALKKNFPVDNSELNQYLTEIYPCFYSLREKDKGFLGLLYRQRSRILELSYNEPLIAAEMCIGANTIYGIPYGLICDEIVDICLRAGGDMKGQITKRILKGGLVYAGMYFNAVRKGGSSIDSELLRKVIGENREFKTMCVRYIQTYWERFYGVIEKDNGLKSDFRKRIDYRTVFSQKWSTDMSVKQREGLSLLRDLYRWIKITHCFYEKGVSAENIKIGSDLFGFILEKASSPIAKESDFIARMKHSPPGFNFRKRLGIISCLFLIVPSVISLSAYFSKIINIHYIKPCSTAGLEQGGELVSSPISFSVMRGGKGRERIVYKVATFFAAAFILCCFLFPAKVDAVKFSCNMDFVSGKRKVVAEVETGDWKGLSYIAKEAYGDALLASKIYEANKEVLKNGPNIVRPGDKLIIPEPIKTELADSLKWSKTLRGKPVQIEALPVTQQFSTNKVVDREIVYCSFQRFVKNLEDGKDVDVKDKQMPGAWAFLFLGLGGWFILLLGGLRNAVIA